MSKPQQNIEIRIGLPLTGGQLVAEAKEHSLPVLFSANAFARRKDGRVKLNKPKAGRYSGLDVALDSAGFVAMAKYKGYDWAVSEYVSLAASHDWTFWAQMDCCCEPEVAADTFTRRIRIAETGRLYGECRQGARRRGIKDPMPVIQGWTLDDYRRCIDVLPIVDWPDLVGVGSVCRRNIHGENGLLAVIETLDDMLPDHVQLHLFGVKGDAISILNGHRRIRSIDSMAWDFSARRKWPTGRTMDKRISEMHRWRKAQLERVAGRFPGTQRSLIPMDSESDELSSEAQAWIDLVADGEIEMQSAGIHAARELAWS